MAFDFKQTSSSDGNWFLWIGIGSIATIILVGTYFLFFAQAPLIDVVIPSELQEVSDLSAVPFKGEELADDPTFQSLRAQVGETRTGNSGRSNPFAPF